jgi:hypothetical protein
VPPALHCERKIGWTKIRALQRATLSVAGFNRTIGSPHAFLGHMSDDMHDERIADLFARAKDLAAEDQARFLDEECRNDPPKVRQRVEKLLAADHELQTTADVHAPNTFADVSASRTVGPYKLLQRIGEGGMGEVWMAEQRHPVRPTSPKSSTSGRRRVGNPTS